MRTLKPALTSLFLLACAFFAPLAQAQTGQISGVAIDSLSGDPIPGVNVVIAVDGSLMGASTGANGTYTISGIEPGSYIVQASFVGYLTRTYQNVQVSAGQTTNLDLFMVSDLLQLDEIYAVAYGATERQAVTGSVASVDLAYLESRPWRGKFLVFSCKTAPASLVGVLPSRFAVRVTWAPAGSPCM